MVVMRCGVTRPVKWVPPRIPLTGGGNGAWETRRAAAVGSGLDYVEDRRHRLSARRARTNR